MVEFPRENQAGNTLMVACGFLLISIIQLIKLTEISCPPVFGQMKEMLPHPWPCKGKFEWIMGVRQVVQAAQAVILALHQVVH